MRRKRGEEEERGREGVERQRERDREKAHKISLRLC